jgi:hypothetical protein
MSEAVVSAPNQPAPCKYFALGKCRHDARCQFSHATSAPLPVSMIERNSVPCFDELGIENCVLLRIRLI